MKKLIGGVIILAAVVGAAFFVGNFYEKNLSGVGPVIKPPPENITEQIAENPPVVETNAATGLQETKIGPLTLPEGFEIEIFGKDLPSARVMAFDRLDSLWVSQTKEGQISFFRAGESEVKTPNTPTRLKNLNNPHGIAFDPGDPNMLYFSEEDKISRVDISCLLDPLSDCVLGEPQKIIDLPQGGRHTTRTIRFRPDGRLFVSIGSSCDVCNEDDPRRAAIYSMNKDGSDFRPFATGLRNAVFFTWFPDLADAISSGAPGVWEPPTMWATEMGRDMLGDNLPPDEINIVEEGKNYGWPICYGKNIHDTEFDKNIYIRNPCMEPFELGSFLDIPAHSAPLGLRFIPETSNWPTSYHNTLLVAYHGSWNRSEPTGYKIVRWADTPYQALDELRLRAPAGFQDFITGWLTEDNEALGRPVDLIFDSNGNLYISDDKAGVIYRVAYVGDKN